MKNKIWLWICISIVIVGGIIAVYLILNPPVENSDIAEIPIGRMR